MVEYNFIENYYSSRFGPQATHQERFAATSIAEIDRPLPREPLSNLELYNRQQQLQRVFEEVRPVPANVPYMKAQVSDILGRIQEVLIEKAEGAQTQTCHPERNQGNHLLRDKNLQGNHPRKMIHHHHNPNEPHSDTFYYSCPRMNNF